MGQFQSRPEDPTEWGGLPSEPIDRRDPTDLQADVAAGDVLTFGLGDNLGSIAITIAGTQLAADPGLADAVTSGEALPDDD